MKRGHDTSQLIHRRAVVVLVLVGLAICVPFFAAATDAPDPRASPALTDVPGTALRTPVDTPAPSTEPTATAPATSPTAEAPESAQPTAAPSATSPASETPDSAEPTPDPGEPTASPTPEATPSLSGGVSFIVTFRTGVTQLDMTARVAEVRGTMDTLIPELRMAGVRLPDQAAADALRADSAVVRVEVDRTRAAEASPSDPHYGDQWALDRIGWSDREGTSAERVIVAILDTGVAANHPDLVGRLLPGQSFVEGVAADTDANGHGTWMAGIVAAATDNDLGVAGVGWDAVQVLPITVLNEHGLGRDSDVIAGLVAAVDAHADVALLAFSSPDYSRALQAAVDYAWANDVVVVAAAGNDGSQAPAYPAGDRSVIGVASTDHADSLAPGSNHGAATFIGAPGVDILTTDRGGDYRSINGTSAAAAIVAGAAADILASDAHATNAIVAARLARNATGPADGTNVGNGRLDLARALLDRTTSGVRPEGAAPTGSGGPFIGPYLAAATVTWTGGGTDNNWTNPANWGGAAPVAGDDLVFPTGAARLSNTNDFAAGTGFNSITLSGSGYTLAGNSIALGAGGITSSAAASTNTISTNLTMAADRTMTVTSATSTLTLGGVISGAGGVVKAGAGVLALSGTNTYTGVTSVGAGGVEVMSNAALGGTGSGTTVTAGAVVTLNGSGLTVAEPITLNGSGIASSGALRNAANNNTWSGATTLASATTVVSASGTLTWSGAVTTAGFALTVDAAGNVTKSAGAISGTGGVTKEGAGILTFGVANTYSGATTINVGTVRLTIANGIGSSSAVTVASTATFDLGGFSDTIGTLAGSGSVTSGAAGSMTLTTGGTPSTTFAGVISDGSGVVALTKAGSGTFTLSGANTYSGITRINTGVLAVSSDAALGTAPGSAVATQLTFGGGTLQATASFTLNSNRGVTMTGAGTFLVDPTMTLSYGGVIAGAGGLTKTGTGTLVLSGTSSWTSTMAISAGVLRVQSNAALGATSSGTSVSSGAALEIDGSGLVIAENITSLSGSGVSATGSLRNLANSNAWSGTINLAAASRINSDGGLLTLGGNITGAAQTLTVGGAGSTTINGVIGTTTGGLIKDGAGTLVLGAANTYTGATTINGGTVQLAIANGVGPSSALSVASGATFDLAGFSDTIGSLTGAGSVTSSAAGAVTLTCGGLNSSTTYSGVMSNGAGTVALTKVGTGTLTLSGVNTFGGATTINGGSVSVPADTGLGTAPGSPTAGHLTFNGGTLVASATLTLDSNRGVALTGAGTFSAGSGITLTYGGTIAGAGTLAKVGTGTVALSGANTYSGATTITAGTLSVPADSALGTPPASPTAGHLTFGGGTLLSTASFALDANRGVALTGAGTFNVNASVTVTYSGVVAGASTLTKSGTGVLVLAGTNTHTGTTAVSAGVLRVQSAGALGGTATGTTVSSGAAIEIDGSGLNIAEPVTSLRGTGVGAAGAIRNLAGDNTWSGPFTMAASSRINSDAGTLALSGGVAGNTFTLTLGGAGNTSVAAAIATTTGGLTKDGAGTSSIGVAATYTGATTVSAGTLKLEVTNALSASSVVTVSTGATLDVVGASQTFGSLTGAGSVTSSAAGAVTVTTGGLNTSTTYSGVMSNGAGTVSLVKVGSGTLTLSGVNTFTGTTTVNAGTVSVAADTGLGSAPSSASPSQLVLNGGTLLATATLTLDANRGVEIQPGTTLSVNSSRTLTVNGVIHGPGDLIKTGPGTLTLAGVNTYTGGTTLSAGTITVPADSGLGTAPVSATPGHLTFGGGTLLASASFTLDANRGVALTSVGTFNVNAGVTLSYTGIVAGAGNLAKSGTGTLVLAGANTYTGTTTVSAGTLSVAADSALGTAPASAVATQITFGGGTLLASAPFTLDANRGITLTGAGTLNVDPGVTLTYAGVVAGASNLAKTGVGMLVLSGANTYAGTTTVSGGVLRIQNGAALGGTASGTSVASGASIEIDGVGLTVAEPITSLIGTGVGAAGALRNLANDNTWSGAIVLGSGGARVNSDAGSLAFTSGFTGNTRPLTVGGAGNTLISGVIGTTTGTLTKDGTGTLSLSAANAFSGRTTINGGIVSITADNNLGTPPATPTASQLTFSGGTLATGATFVLDANRGISIGTGGGGLDVASSTTLTYAGTATGSSTSGMTTKSGSGVLDLSASSFTVGGLTISGGSIVAPTSQLFDLNGDLFNDSGPGALVAGAGTVTLSRAGAAQAIGGIYPIDFYGLTLNNSAGATIGFDVTVNGVLTLSSGNITTGGFTLGISDTGSVSRTSGHVVGNLRKHVPTGAPALVYEVGDAAQYAPINLAFNNVSVAGDLTASTTAGDHPALGGSSIDPSSSANRFWTLSGAGISYTDYAATFTFGAADVDAGADTADFGVARHSGGSWQSLLTSTQTPTSTGATGITGFGDFAVGELGAGALHHFNVSAPASATAGAAFDVTVTAVDALGNRIGAYGGTINLSSTDPYAAFSPASYAFLPADHGSKTFASGATLFIAGAQTVTATEGATTGVSDSIAVAPGPFVKLQVLAPGETTDPGSATGATGAPLTQIANSSFSVTVNSVDAYWNAVASSDVVALTSSDAFANLPANAPLVAGTLTAEVTAQAGGATTFTATDVSDGGMTPGTSSSIAVTNSAPTALADSYEMYADNVLSVAAAGVLANDTDPEVQPLAVAAPRPLSGPDHGSLTLNADGSFTYTPSPGYEGADTFTYAATDPGVPSAPATVTILVRDQSLISSSGWGTAFDSGRYIELSYPPYVPAGSVVSGATLHFSYRSLDGAGSTCYYVEVYAGGSMLATHGSAGSPISCNGGAGYAVDDVSMPELDSTAEANDLTIRIFMSNSAGARSQINNAVMDLDYHLQ